MNQNDERYQFISNTAVTAMNIMDGLNPNPEWDNLQPVWEDAGMGFIEFCMWLADFAIESEEELRRRAPQDFPGVYDYEVSAPFGAQLRMYMLTQKKLPTDEDMRHWLKVLIGDFFKQGTHETP